MAEPMSPPMSDPSQATHFRGEREGRVVCIYCWSGWLTLRQIHSDPTKAICHKRQSLLFGSHR